MNSGHRLRVVALFATLPMIAAAPVATMPIASPGAAKTTAAMPLRVARWRPFIAEAAQHFGIPVEWIAAVMAAESGGETMRDGRPITSRAGAMGLMQVMPVTWQAMRTRYGLGDNPHDPRANILAGAAYLRLMHDRFGYPGLFGAYNAGPGRYADHLATGRSLPAETRAYVARLANRPATPAMPPAIMSGERLFFTLGGMESPPRPRRTEAIEPPLNGLFVPLVGAPRRDR